MTTEQKLSALKAELSELKKHPIAKMQPRPVRCIELMESILTDLVQRTESPKEAPK